jgi:hypothetical protein
VALPLSPLTVTLTVNACAVVMLEEESITVTVGVTISPVSPVVPETLDL